MASIPQQLALTQREEIILSLAVAGLSDTEIAEELSISKKTLQGHWRRICSKAGQKRPVLVGRTLREAVLTAADSTEDPQNALLVERGKHRFADLKFQALAELVPMPIFVLDFEREFVCSNPAWQELTGISATKNFVADWQKHIHEEDRDGVIAAWNYALDHDEPFESVHRINRLDNASISVSVRIVEMRRQDHLLGYLGMATAIDKPQVLSDEFARINQELVASLSRAQTLENRFRSFMDRIPGICFIKDESRRLVYLSRGFSEAFNFPAGMALGKRDEDFLPGSVSRRTKELESRLLERESGEAATEIDDAVSGGRRWLIHRFAFKEGESMFLGGLSFEITALWEAEERFHASAEASVDGLVIMRPDRDWQGKIVDFTFAFANASAKSIFGPDYQTLIGRTLLDSFRVPNASKLVRMYRKVLSTGKPFQIELIGQGAGAKGKILLLQAVKAGDSVAVSLRDLTEERESRRMLQEAEERLRVGMEALHEGFVVVDSDGIILDMNLAAGEIFGCRPESVRGTPFSNASWQMLDKNGTIIPFSQRPISLGIKGKSIRNQEMRMLRADGLIVNVRLNVAPLYLRKGSVPSLVVASFTDISVEVDQRERLAQNLQEIGKLNELLNQRNRDLELANEQLTISAATDSLTGLMNRGRFQTVFGEEVERANRYSRRLSIALLDVDHFKQFNDKFGHIAGDECLRVVANALREVQRTSDSVARFGGEEFLILMPETSREEAITTAERVRKHIASLSNPHRAVTISIGVSTLCLTHCTPESLLEAADKALYLAKQQGRNAVRHVGQLESQERLAA